MPASGNISTITYQDPAIISSPTDCSQIPFYHSEIDYIQDMSEEDVRFCEEDFSSPLNQRSPLTTIQSDHLNNYIEISKASDIKTIGKENKVRISRNVAREVRQNSSSVGNFGWGLAKRLYSLEELLPCNYRGIGKEALSPRRKQCIEEAVRDNYGNREENFKQVRTAIDAGIRDRKKRVPAPSTASRLPLILPQGFDYNMLLKNSQP